MSIQLANADGAVLPAVNHAAVHADAGREQQLLRFSTRQAARSHGMFSAW
jgi:hypothetical protein